MSKYFTCWSGLVASFWKPSAADNETKFGFDQNRRSHMTTTPSKSRKNMKFFFFKLQSGLNCGIVPLCIAQNFFWQHLMVWHSAMHLTTESTICQLKLLSSWIHLKVAYHEIMITWGSRGENSTHFMAQIIAWLEYLWYRMWTYV